jgi:hypothetical protein
VSEREKVRRRVGELAEAGLIDDEALPEGTRVLDPIPVADPASGERHSWFVPVARGERLAGFAQLLPDLRLMRYSTFPSGESGAALPDLADWTDASRIRSRAEQIAEPGERVGEPVLTYDRDASRLAWRVPVTDESGSSRALFVAGNSAYPERPEPDEPEIGQGFGR